MCGLAAFIKRRNFYGDAHAAVENMCAAMRMRGPDAEGYWECKSRQVVMGHRRLAILDLNERSNQPLVSDDGRYAIVYNGEIYNFRAIKKELEGSGQVFQTESDTEVLLKLYAMEGEQMLSRLRGMYAFTIWDARAESLFVARDPYGIKPLYMATTSDAYLVASQVKALLASGLVSAEQDPHGIAGFWLMGSVPEPRTWFKEIQVVPAGSWLRIDSKGIHGPTNFHDLSQCWCSTTGCVHALEDVQEQVRLAVMQSVRDHMTADVPVGIFLSGGLDSASIAGLVKEIAPESIHATTIRFPEYVGGNQDESIDAGHIASRYGLKHHIRTVTREEFEADLPEIIRSMDQPSIDGINTWYASKAIAEQGLRVTVSGVGGDELFYGYSSFRKIPRLVSQWSNLTRVPGATVAATVIAQLYASSTGNPRWESLPEYANSIEGAYFLSRSLFTVKELPLLMGEELAMTVINDLHPEDIVRSAGSQMPADTKAAVGMLESMNYLRNQLLRDCDWASMAHSVELRTPLVDAWLLKAMEPMIQCFGKYNGKQLLAHSPATSLPKSVLNKTKTGFGIPLECWLRESDLLENIKLPDLLNRSNVSASRLWAGVVAEMVYA